MRKGLSLLLVFVMLVGLVPGAAATELAEMIAPATDDGISVTVTVVGDRVFVDQYPWTNLSVHNGRLWMLWSTDTDDITINVPLGWTYSILPPSVTYHGFPRTSVVIAAPQGFHLEEVVAEYFWIYLRPGSPPPEPDAELFVTIDGDRIIVDAYPIDMFFTRNGNIQVVFDAVRADDIIINIPVGWTYSTTVLNWGAPVVTLTAPQGFHVIAEEDFNFITGQGSLRLYLRSGPPPVDFEVSVRIDGDRIVLDTYPSDAEYTLIVQRTGITIADIEPHTTAGVVLEHFIINVPDGWTYSISSGNFDRLHVHITPPTGYIVVEEGDNLYLRSGVPPVADLYVSVEVDEDRIIVDTYRHHSGFIGPTSVDMLGNIVIEFWASWTAEERIAISLPDNWTSSVEVRYVGDSNQATITITPPTGYIVVEEGGNLYLRPALVALPFTDIRTADWFYPYVRNVFQRNIMQGASATEFHPTGDFTRSMVMATLYRMVYGGPAREIPYANNRTVFSDVYVNAWYSHYVIWAYDYGIVGGVGGNRFAPGQPVSRQEFAVMMHRFAGAMGHDTAVRQGPQWSSFTDLHQIATWPGAREALTWANYHGLIGGRPGPIIAPGGTAVRAEAAAILMRYVEAFGTDGTPQRPPTQTPDQSQFEREVFDLVNIQRANHGLQLLEWDNRLATIARAHSVDMATRGFFAHTCPSGITMGARIQNANISFRWAAENIAWGHRTPQAVVDGWMDSPGHRANILNPNLTHLGVGFHDYYWTQKFIGV